MFSKFPSYLYQRKRKMNATFTREFFAFTNSGSCSYKDLILSPITTLLLILLLVIHSSKNSIRYGGQAEAYLEPSRTSTMELPCENS